MITISAPKRGIALMMGGKFLPILDPKTPTVFWNQGVKHYQLDTKTFDAWQGKTPTVFWNQGVKHYQLDTKTFDAWQGKAEKSTLDDETVDKLIKGLKK